MKIATGTDIIEISRIKNAIEKRTEKFLRKIFTENEIKYCETKNKAKYEAYAVRFAAKEAIYKAINDDIDSNISWLDVEITNKENGKPEVIFLNKKYQEIECIDISLSHCKEYAIATVVIIYNKEKRI